MHTYSVDKDLRAKVVVGIFIASMLISLILNDLFADIIRNMIMYLEQSSVKKYVKLLEWLEVNPNFLGIPFWYGIISFVYDRWIWKWKLFECWHHVPNLEGKWTGILTSSYDEKSISMNMDIKQTWNKISFKSTFPDTNSKSYSNVAAIHVAGNSGIEIYFGYRNDSYSVSNKLQSYNGYNILQLIDKNKIKARYFNERENPNPKFKGGNKGIFELNKVSR